MLQPGGRDSRVHVDFEHAGQPHRWELYQAPEDGLTQRYLDCVEAPSPGLPAR